MSALGDKKLCEIIQGHHVWVSKKKRSKIWALPRNEIERFETVIRCRNCGYQQLMIESTGYCIEDMDEIEEMAPFTGPLGQS